MKAISINIILFLTSFKHVEATECTLCAGTQSTPNPDDIISIGNDTQTCRNASMLAVFEQEDSQKCQTIRDAARIICGCGTDAPSISPTVEVTTIIDKEPNCGALRNGYYPFPFSAAQSLSLYYYAVLELSDGNGNGNGNGDASRSIPFLTNDIVREFEDAASSVVSAGAAGCDQTRRLLRRGLNENKIHYVIFSGLQQRDGVSCSTTSSDACYAVQGKIDVVYSSMSISGSDTTDLNWLTTTIFNIMNNNGGSAISSKVSEISSFGSAESATAVERLGPASATQLASSSKGLAVGLGVGCSIFALIAGALSMFVFKRGGGIKQLLGGRTNTATAARTGSNSRRNRKISRKIERVDIMSKNYGRSDESLVEYVEPGAIHGDDSVSNAPTIECKKIVSVETTLLRRSPSYYDSSSSSSSGDDDIDGVERDTDTDSYRAHGFDDSSIDSPILQLDDYSEMSPYDESPAYQQLSPPRRQVVVPLVFVNQEGREVQQMQTQEQAPTSLFQEQAPVRPTQQQERNDSGVDDTVYL